MYKPNRKPGSVWTLRGIGTDFVRTAKNEKIEIFIQDWAGYYCTISLSRKDARLLAKRINQCLDGS